MSRYKIDVKAWIDWALRSAILPRAHPRGKPENQNNHMIPKLILGLGLPCNRGEDVGTASVSAQAWNSNTSRWVSQWSWHGDKVATAESFVCRLSSASGPQRKLPSSAATSPAWGCSGVKWQWWQWPWASVELSLWESQTKVREAVWGWGVGQCSSALLHIWCWCPDRHRAGCQWVPCWEASNLWETMEEPKPSRGRCAPDACSDLLTEVGGKGAVGLCRVLLSQQGQAVVLREAVGAVLALMWFLWLCLCLPRACHAGTHPTLPRVCGHGTTPMMATGIWGEGRRGEAKECLL